MSLQSETEKKRFYLVSTDVLQGISIFLMVIGHTALWWDGTLDSQYPNLPLFPLILLLFAFLVPPGFLFWYTFNTVNSLLRKSNSDDRLEARRRLLNRTLMFILIAEFSEIMAGLITSPENLLSFILNWELFHMFALATLLPLVVFEVVWFLESKKEFTFNISSMLFLGVILFVLLVFLTFHDYSQSIQVKTFKELELESLLKRVLIDDGQSPIFPYLSFSAAGGFLATYLNLPNQDKKSILTKAPFVLLFGLTLFVIGILLTSIEPYTSAPVGVPASSPFVLISIGAHIMSTCGLILIIDIDSIFDRSSVNKFLLPFVLLSKITLTVYLTHNLLYIIPSDFPLIDFLITDINAIIVFGFFYTVFFILIAIIWSKYKFRYSLEWCIWRFQKIRWRS